MQKAADTGLRFEVKSNQGGYVWQATKAWMGIMAQMVAWLEPLED